MVVCQRHKEHAKVAWRYFEFCKIKKKTLNLRRFQNFAIKKSQQQQTVIASRQAKSGNNTLYFTWLVFLFSVYQNVVLIIPSMEKGIFQRDKTPFCVKYLRWHRVSRCTVWRLYNFELTRNSQTSDMRTKINATSLLPFFQGCFQGHKRKREKKFRQFSFAWFSYQTEVIAIIPLPQAASGMIKKETESRFICDMRGIYIWKCLDCF